MSNISILPFVTGGELSCVSWLLPAATWCWFPFWRWLQESNKKKYVVVGCLHWHESCVQYFTEYGPSFELDIVPSGVRNLNTETYIEQIVATVLSMFCMIYLLHRHVVSQHFVNIDLVCWVVWLHNLHVWIHEWSNWLVTYTGTLVHW